jgi:malonyl-CoA/methylmalonyl-CoA synthetase
MIGQPVLERYGLTETIMNTSNPFKKRKPGSVGLPLPSVRIRLLDEKLRELTKPNEIGEVCVKGPNVFSGYWRDLAATRKAFCEGWFRTGDVGYRDGDGYYHLLGRLSQDMIKSGGYRIGAREIEEVLLRHPSVQEAAVVGLPDPDLGEKVVAFVVCKGGATEDQLKVYCEPLLASFKRPRVISFLEGLPRNAMGKITKSELKQIL